MTKYEAAELSETAAAARTPMYHEGSIFVDVSFSTDAEAVATWREETGLDRLWPYVDDVETWLRGEQLYNIFRPQPYRQPYIYVYAPVSKLGALSQQEGVTLVEALQDRDGSFAASQSARGASGASGTEATTTPWYPTWLEEDPYPKLKGRLQELVYRYEQGELTAAEVASEFEVRQGSSVHVDVELSPDPANTDALAAWLKSKGGSSLLITKSEVYPNGISGFVPVSLMAALSQQPGVSRIITPSRSGGGSKRGPSLTPTPQGAEQSNAPPTPTPVLSQGVAAHGATAWNPQQIYCITLRISPWLWFRAELESLPASPPEDALSNVPPSSMRKYPPPFLVVNFHSFMASRRALCAV